MHFPLWLLPGYPSIYLSIYVSVCLSIYLSINGSSYLSNGLPTYLLTYPCVCPSRPFGSLTSISWLPAANPFAWNNHRTHFPVQYQKQLNEQAINQSNQDIKNNSRLKLVADFSAASLDLYIYILYWIFHMKSFMCIACRTHFFKKNDWCMLHTTTLVCVWTMPCLFCQTDCAILRWKHAWDQMGAIILNSGVIKKICIHGEGRSTVYANMGDAHRSKPVYVKWSSDAQPCTILVWIYRMMRKTCIVVERRSTVYSKMGDAHTSTHVYVTWSPVEQQQAAQEPLRYRSARGWHLSWIDATFMVSCDQNISRIRPALFLRW